MSSPEYQAKLREEAYGDARKVIEEELKMTNDFELDLDNRPPSEHKWVERGCILSCENAGHPNHRHYIKSSSTDLTSNS